ncbi:ankyrin repeat-containing domain protein [Usnea florida]
MPSPTDDGPELPTNFLDQSDSIATSGDVKHLDAILKRWQSHVAPSEIPFDELRQVLYSAISANQVAVVSLLLNRGAKVEEDIGDAARLANASTDMYRVFLDHGWDINSRDVRGRPFVQTVLDDRPLLEFLISNNADLNARGLRWDTTALDLAAATKPLSTVKFLLSHGATIAGANPLHEAASSSTEEDRREIMKFFLDDCRVDINAISQYGHRMNKRDGDENGTPLQAAIRSGNRDRIRLLLERGADLDVRNERQQTALEYARDYEFDVGIRILEEKMGFSG